MIALRALPGSAFYEGDDRAIVERARLDAVAYLRAGVDSVILENDHDLPFVKPPLPREAIEVAERAARAVREVFPNTVGIQLLEGANEQALEIAAAADLDFLRVEAFVYAHVGGAGIIEASAGSLLRKRSSLGCRHIKVFADIKKKHCSHALTSDLTIFDEAKQAEFFRADGLVVTGMRTGEVPSREELALVRSATKLPILIGSGMDAENIRDYHALADGFIVGSTFRRDGKFLEELDEERLERFVSVWKAL